MTGTDLRTARERKGLSQVQAAEELNVHTNTLARWERGELGIHRLRWNTIRRWMRKDVER